LNNDGVKGVVSDGNICFLIGRVFGESGEGTKMSYVFNAVEWMVEEGAHVINMSLSGGPPSQTGAGIFKNAYKANTILVAAAGNGGGSADQYPASYNDVISVAAVDAEKKRASFSQYNSGVDIAAPGVDILSTVPLNLGGAVLLSSEDVGVTGKFMRDSATTDKVEGELVFCDLGLDRCPGEGGHICLIER
jgi:subtilisin family serine protease